MNSQHFFENHVSKKHKEALMKAIGPIEMLRQSEIEQKLIDAGKEERIKQAKMSCKIRKLKKMQKYEKEKNTKGQPVA